MLNRSPSTISREVQRNRGRRYYKAVDANNRANRMAKKTKTVLTGSEYAVARACSEKLEMKCPQSKYQMVKANEAASKHYEYHLRQFIRRFTFVVEALHHLNVQHLRRSHSSVMAGAILAKVKEALST